MRRNPKIGGRPAYIPGGTAAQALDIAARHPGEIDLLISDISMPGGISGMELAERLTRTHPETRVVLMSGSRSDDFATSAPWQFLSKPFLPEELKACAANALAAHYDASMLRPFPLALPGPSQKRE